MLVVNIAATVIISGNTLTLHIVVGCRLAAFIQICGSGRLINVIVLIHSAVVVVVNACHGFGRIQNFDVVWR